MEEVREDWLTLNQFMRWYPGAAIPTAEQDTVGKDPLGVARVLRYEREPNGARWGVAVYRRRT